MSKVVFGTGAFGTPLRVEISDEHIQKASEILLVLENLVEEYDCEFEANISIREEEEENYGAGTLWLSIEAGPDTEVKHSAEILEQLLTGETPNAIILKGGGPEGPEIIDYMDIRDMPDLHISEMMSYYVYDAQDKPNGMNEGWIEEVLKPLCESDEEYEALIQAGKDYGERLKELKEDD